VDTDIFKERQSACFEVSVLSPRCGIIEEDRLFKCSNWTADSWY